MELEIHVEDFSYDTGYGIQHGDLYITVEARIEKEKVSTSSLSVCLYVKEGVYYK